MMEAETKALIDSGVKAGIAQLREQMLSGKTPDLAAAYVKFWGEVGTVVVKDAQNPHQKNTYATLEACMRLIKPVLAANSLALLSMPGVCREGAMSVTTMLIHKSGQIWQFTTELPMVEGLDKKTGKPKQVTPQSAGSVITYIRRYVAQAFAGIAPGDDDGEAASQQPAEEVEDAAPDTGAEIADLTDGMASFKAKKAETMTETLARFKTQYEARVSATGDSTLVEAYMAHRKLLRATEKKAA